MNHRRPYRIVLACLGLLFAVAAFPQASHAATLTATQAKDHVGENATVCGVVVDTKFAARTKGQPTFLNLDKPYPEHIFTALIWGSDRPRFGQPEATYKGKQLCVTGTIKAYRGVHEIVVTEPGQLRKAAVVR